MTQLGKYTLHEEIGRGGFGAVYRATDTALQREVALKVLHPQLTTDPDFLEKFRNEARIVANLKSHHIVTIYDLDEADGRVFIAMEYMDGGSLKEKLESQGAYSFAETVRIFRQIGDGLNVAHRKGLVHRDIKPANILFDSEGNAAISDFGLAKAVQNSSMVAMTSMGSVGTPAYRAPELWQGSQAPTIAIDIYSIGCILFEMLTGKVLFDGDTPEKIITQHLITGPQLAQDFVIDGAGDVRALIASCLMKDPAERFSAIESFLAALASPPVQQKESAKPAPRRPKKATPAQVRTTEKKVPQVIRQSSPKGRSATKLGIGSTMISEKDGMTMVYVTAGEFLMGSRDDDPDADGDEKPQHTVYMDAYWIDQTPVTNAMFAKFLNEDGQKMDKEHPWFNIHRFSDGRIEKKNGLWQVDDGLEHHPVVNVTWYGAQAYAQWAGKQLPSEAQWEKAARGTDGRTYPWGEGIDSSLANFEHPVRGTIPVGSFPTGASPYGALDMAGNVWEWVADWYRKDYYRISVRENPSGPDKRLYRVLRGGRLGSHEEGTRFAKRLRYEPDFTNFDVGFRCVRLP